MTRVQKIAVTLAGSLVLAYAVAALWLMPAVGQDAAVVVPSCAVLGQVYGVGSTRPITVDMNGNLCATSTGPTGITQGVTAAGSAGRVSQEPTQLLWDDFGSGTLDTAAAGTFNHNWVTPTASAGTLATNAVGATVLGTGTTFNAWSILQSQKSFRGNNPGWVYFQEHDNFEFPILLNALRFWGFGTFPAQPTTASPYLNAVGFELGTDGHLRAVTAASGTRLVIADLSLACPNTVQCAIPLVGKVLQPQDNATHKYIIYFRGDNIFWTIDGPDNVVAITTTGASGPDINTLPLAHLAVAGAPGPSSTATIQVNQATVADTARNTVRVCDATYPWLCAGTAATTSGASGINGNVSAGVNAVPGRISYLCALDIGLIGANATSATVSNLNGGVLPLSIQANSTFAHTYTPCLMGQGIGTAIAVSVSGASAGVLETLGVTGYQQ